MMLSLQRALKFLLDESPGEDELNRHHHHHHHHHIREHLDHLETSAQLRLLQQLLCQRWPYPPLPDDLLDDIDLVLQRQRSHRLLTLAQSIPPKATLTRDSRPDVNLLLWQGDITALTGTTAITNAANEQMLGCFQPTHRCIDNVIHSWAGPRLRDECARLRKARGHDLDVGEAIVTPGYCLPSPYVIHVVGPQLERGAASTETQRIQLARCYESVLDAAEALPADRHGRKVVALCGISTGLFAFPKREAATIAVKTVLEWVQRRGDASITDVIFNTFTDTEHAIYQDVLTVLPEPWVLRSPADDPARPLVRCDALALARQWLDSADYVVISAGAGLSAATGLDYTSKTLFAKRFPGFLKYGFTTLYSVFGYSAWPSEQDRWGYYFTHLALVQSWPESFIYNSLIRWLQERFGQRAHIRTSNADGLFLRHGWPADQISTPQGTYAVLQCLARCRPEATVPSAPLVEAALPALDPVTQRLNDPEKVPRCRFCGGKMSICVRAGEWFDEAPFRDGEARWKEFRRRVLVERKNVVILELGAGMSTPGVLRWPNEDLVSEGKGMVKLVRVGLGPDVAVPWDLEEGVATCIDGDIAAIVRDLILSSPE